MGEYMKELLDKEANAVFDMGKSITDTDPEKLRKIGNLCLQLGDHWNAICAYTKSLAMAPAGSKLRGLAYANRSDILLALGFYEECISDAKIALQNQYPDNLVHKLHMRMAVCKKALGKAAEAEESQLAAVQAIKRMEMTSESEANAIKGLMLELRMNRKPKMPKFGIEYVEPPPLSYGPNPKDPRISAALNLKKGGKSLIANRKLKIGDVLAVEEPAFFKSSSMIDIGEPSWIHCSKCLKLCVNLTPCKTCSWVCYCSDKCKSEAWEKYHRYECRAKEKLIKTLLEDGVKSKMDFIFIVNYSFAMIFGLGLENCIRALSSDGQFSNKATEQIKKLMQMPVRSDGHYLISDASNLFIVNMVADCLGSTIERKQALFEFLQKALLVLHSNWLPINDTMFCYSDNKLFCQSSRPIGLGVYPIFNSIKGGCDCNVVRNMYRQTFVVQAVRPIKKGEEILMDKGGLDYSKNPLQIRRFFYSEIEGTKGKCNCRACKEIWPTHNEQVKCYEDISKNPANKDLMRELCCTDAAFFGKESTGSPVSMFKPETLEIWSKVLELYIDHRRDDQLYNQVIKFVCQYLSLATKKIVTDPAILSSENLDHCITFDDVRCAIKM